MLHRREFLTGAAALAAYAEMRSAEALVGSQRALLGGARAGPPIVFHGDSITMPTGGGAITPSASFPQKFAAASAARNGAPFTVKQRGLNGSSWNYSNDGGVTPTLQNDAATQVDIYASPTTKLVLFAGTNGLMLGSHTPATEFSDFTTYLTARLSAGWVAANIYVLTMLPRQAYSEPNRDTYNASLVTGAGTYGYKIVRLEVNEDIGVAGQQNQFYFNADHIHPLANGQDQIAEHLFDVFYSKTWTPAMLAATGRVSCKLWIDAQNSGSITQAGGLVSQMSDLSGSGNHMTSSGTNRPGYSATSSLNSHPGLTFDGANSYLVNTAISGLNANDVTVFAVAQFNITTECLIFDLSPTQLWAAGLQYYKGNSATPTINISDNINGGNLASPTVSTPASSHVYSGYLSTEKIQRSFLDGVSTLVATGGPVAPKSPVAATGLMIGHGFQLGLWIMNGTVGEGAIFTGRLAAVDRRRMESYLTPRWA